MNNKKHKLYIPKKSVKNFSLPILGLGTYGIGGLDKRNFNSNDGDEIQALQDAFSAGVTYIDTAESYADGYAEVLIGKAIKNLDRSNLFICTKVRKSNLRYDDIIRSAKGSLGRLGVDNVDLYLIHSPNKDVPIKESMKAMDFLLENQLVKNIGVSNFNLKSLEEAMSYTKYSIVNNQIHYNLTARAYEEDGTLDFCNKNKILVTAYRVIGFDQYKSYGLEILKRLSKKYEKTVSQIALSWILQKPNIVTLVQTKNLKHLIENISVIGWQMELEDRIFLDNNFPKGVTINTF
jgi:diketogulonate reductase-like aldo/keto reductase